jgi:hypothetical protein
VTGIQVGDMAFPFPPATLDTRLQASQMLQSTADRLTVRICNADKNTDVNAAAASWGYIVTR